MSASHEKRKYPRAEIRWPVTIMTPDGPKEGETSNIGTGGALISCDYPLPLHKRVCVIFKVPNRSPIVVNTMVARSNISKTGEKSTVPEVAFYYLELTDEEIQFLHAAVAESE
jgi:hypothetical protein